MLPPPPATPTPRPSRGELLVVAGLLLLHVALATTATRDKSPTFDEVAHLTRAHVFWRTGDFRLAPPHPPLSHLWVGLPPFRPAATLPSQDDSTWRRADTWGYGRLFFYGSGNDILRLLARGRTMVAILSAALGLAIWWWSRSLFGSRGGLLSLALFVFEPSLLAHGSLVTTDTCIALFVLVSVGAASRACSRPTPGTVLLSGLALAGAFLSKLAAGVLIPVLLALAALRIFSTQPLTASVGRRSWMLRSRRHRATLMVSILVAQAVVVHACIWTAYGLRYSTTPPGAAAPESMRGQPTKAAGRSAWEIDGHPGLEAVVESLRRHRVLPEAYLYGIVHGSAAAAGNGSFLDGEHSQHGFRTFFPRAFLYKTPLPLLAILVLAALAALARARRSGDARADWIDVGRRAWQGAVRTAPLWLILAAWWAMLIPMTMNIGHRHLLPILPPLLVLAGAAAAPTNGVRGGPRWAVGALVAVHVLASFSVRPHYLAFFNALAGGPANGWRHLVDSSLDWGQDLTGLRDWIASEAEGERVHVAYWGNADPAFFGILADEVPHLSRSPLGDSRPEPGIYCISATALQQVYSLRTSRWGQALEEEYRRLEREMAPFEGAALGSMPSRGAMARARGAAFAGRFDRFQRLRFGRLCAWLRQREPDDHVGWSILIWRMDGGELREALAEPIPAGPG